MKKIVLTILAAAAVLAGCKKTPLESEGKGTLAMSLSSDNKGYSDVVTG